MSTFDSSYDIVIVIGYFRSAAPLLSVIRYLSKDFQVGVIFAPLTDHLALKVSLAQDFFYDLCISYGATPLTLNASYSTKILLVQQFQYSDDFSSQVLHYINYKKIFGVLQLASAGLDLLDEFLTQFNISSAFALDIGLLNFLLSKRDRVHRYDSIQLTEVGLPFAEYPIYPPLDIDWFIACPTTFSFRRERDKHSFLSSVIEFVYSLPSNETIVYKAHNALKRDYFTPKIYYLLSRPFYRFSRLPSLLTLLSRYMPHFLSFHIDKFITSLLHSVLLDLVTPLSEFSSFHHMPIEPYLPFVKKGVIGGLSNVMWASRYYGIKYINFIHPKTRKYKSQFKSNSSNLLDLNVQYFGFPFYNKNSTTSMSILPNPSSRNQPNLVSILRSMLSNI